MYPAEGLFNEPECDWFKPNVVKKKDFLINLIVLLLVKFDLSLISSNVLFTFTSLVCKDFNIKFLSLNSYNLDGNVYPIVDLALYFISKISTF